MKKDRETRILEILTAENRLEVSALAGRVGVSQVTVRKDLDELERLGETSPEAEMPGMLNIALPKGRLGDKVYGLLAGAGCGCP